MKRAIALTHSQPEATTEALRLAAAAAQQGGWVLEIEAEEADKRDQIPDGIVVRDRGAPQPDLCLVLGGDGTILYALRRWAGTGVPVFGINFGTVGFLAAAERDDLVAAFGAAFGGEYEVLQLPGLDLGTESGPVTALNDVSLIRRPHGRVAELGYTLGGKEVGHVRCDGLVAATPAGSTGYNLANNGPILAWGVEGYVVSFIAPHTLTARALVVAPGDVLTVMNAGGRDPVDMIIDGVAVGELASGAEVEVSFRDGASTLAQLPGTNFYRRVGEKFGQVAH